MCASPQMQRTELCLDLQRFLASRQSAETVRFYQVKLNLFLAWLQRQGVTELEDITPQLLRDFLAHLRSSHTLGGQHTYFRCIRAFLRWCWREYSLDGDPLRNVDAPRLAQVPLKAARLEDVRAMLRVCDRRTFEGRRDDALLRFLVDTAIRASECLRLRREDVDLVSGDVRLPPEATKDKEARVVFLGAKSLKALRAYLRHRKDESPFLWVSRGGRPLGYDGLRAILARRSKEAGLSQPVTCHQLRKLTATAMFQDGASIEDVRRLLGHSSLNTTLRYLDVEIEAVRLSHQAHGMGERL